MREHELLVIEQENQRMRERMSKGGASIDSHNPYVLHRSERRSFTAEPLLIRLQFEHEETGSSTG